MVNQVFKENVPNEVLFDLLELISLKTDKYYLIDHNAYKRMIFNNYNERFCNNLKIYYHYSKFFYIERKMTYKSFTNIIRQICKYNNIMFTSHMKYNESQYNIDYLIYY